MTVTRFAIVGGGWRAAFYLRVAAALAGRFEVSRLAARTGRTVTVPGHVWDEPSIASG